MGRDKKSLELLYLEPTDRDLYCF